MGSRLLVPDDDGAVLGGANLTGALLSRADLTGAVSLTQAQLDAAAGHASTMLPAGLARPAHWRT